MSERPVFAGRLRRRTPSFGACRIEGVVEGVNRSEVGLEISQKHPQKSEERRALSETEGSHSAPPRMTT